MTRMPAPPKRTDFTTEDDLKAFDDVVQMRSRQYNAAAEGFEVKGYYGAVLNSPPYARAQLRAAFALRSVGNREGSYSHHDREWVDQVLSHELDCLLVLSSHTRDAVAVGVRPEAIEALWEGRDEDLTVRERLLARYIRQVANGRVDDATFSAVRDELGLRGIVEYTAFIGHLTIVLRMHQAFDVPGDLDSREELLALVRGIREGAVEVPDAVDAVRVGR
jgi:alkylhydroperoxidase family enzyme